MDGTNHTTTPPPSGTELSITEELKDSNGKGYYLHSAVEKSNYSSLQGKMVDTANCLGMERKWTS